MHCAYDVDFNPQTLVSQSKFQDKNKQVWLCVYVVSMGNLEIHTAHRETVNVLDYLDSLNQVT